MSLSSSHVATKAHNATPSFAVGDKVRSVQHFRGVQDRRCYNDVPKGTIGKIVGIRRMLNKKNPDQSKMSVTVDFEVKIDEKFMARHPANWREWYPKGWVVVRHQTTCDTITLDT